MALTKAQLLTRFKTYLRAEEAAPAPADIQDDSIVAFANNRTGDVINVLGVLRNQGGRVMAIDTTHFPSLLAVDTSITFSGGSAALPTSYFIASAVKVDTTNPAITKKRCRLTFDPDEFNRWDSSNFVLTPSQERPFALAADNIYIKPSSLTAGYIDYIKQHPTISDSQGTVFDSIGDGLLLNYILFDYFSFIEEEQLASKYLQLATRGS